VGRSRSGGTAALAIRRRLQACRLHNRTRNFHPSSSSSCSWPQSLARDRSVLFPLCNHLYRCTCLLRQDAIDPVLCRSNFLFLAPMQSILPVKRPVARAVSGRSSHTSISWIQFRQIQRGHQILPSPVATAVEFHLRFRQISSVCCALHLLYSG
jgi:hypothetical protein